MYNLKFPIIVSILILSFIYISCETDSKSNMDNEDGQEPVPGLALSNTLLSPESVTNSIINTLESNEAIGIIGNINHSENAEGVDLALGYTRTILFGNPSLGTPLMQDNITAGLDLPQKIIVYNRGENETYAAYNSIDYLINRHQLDGVETLDMIKGALNNIVTSATQSTVEIESSQTIEYQEGIIFKTSNNDFETTYSKLKAALESAGPISIMAELDHQSNAQSVGLELEPTRLIVFGNPSLGTTLMQENQTAAISLPQKMLVYQNDQDEVTVAYNDPQFIAKRHQLNSDTEEITSITNALQNFASIATE